MKKLILTLTALAIATPAFAQSELPFVGERSFAFGIDGSDNTITVAKNGNTTITNHRLGDSQTTYQGKYHPYLPIKKDGKTILYLHIKGDNIQLLDVNKKLQHGCFTYKSGLDDTADKPCITELQTIKP